MDYHFPWSQEAMVVGLLLTITVLGLLMPAYLWLVGRYVEWVRRKHERPSQFDWSKCKSSKADDARRRKLMGWSA